MGASTHAGSLNHLGHRREKELGRGRRQDQRGHPGEAAPRGPRGSAPSATARLHHWGLTPPAAPSVSAHFTDQATEAGWWEPTWVTSHVSAEVQSQVGPCASPRASVPADTGPRPSTYLDPLDALGDDIGVVHGHQWDLDSSHPAHSVCPHPCGQSRGWSALWAPAGVSPQACLP